MPKIKYLKLAIIFSVILNLGSAEKNLSKPKKVKVRASYVVIGKWGKGAGQFGVRWEWMLPEYPNPADFSIDPYEETIWIADTLNRRICCYDTKGKFKFICGKGKIKGDLHLIAAGSECVFALDLREVPDPENKK